ncbi:hypothetical protein [Nocardioides sp. zg-1228]|uniref:hypothetical protein n=1 Tax=Nocardioides sp. zg-1228 TaxID=2763008 RepID=UPI0016428F68|nr:hypothetical protein [Nocardioides sp. zg-1228]MBC2932408.1 hypothetical protein [Nocardioides sp. zg-1228]QSF57920.1 hypothetical protein JX575_01415 [Nocardioides sp. zg-1228]
MPDERPPLWRGLEIGRLLRGSLVEMFIKAYGAGAALSVALSDAETVAGKAGDAVRAVPNLAERYEQASYAVDHREEIQSAIAYLNDHTVSQDELERTADDSVETLGAIESTYEQLGEARSVLEIDGIRGTYDNVRSAVEHVDNAWDAKPDLEAVRQLSEVAEQVRPLVGEVDVLIPVYYGGLLALMDNFARDEIVGTLVVMGAALGISVVLGRAVGFWVRRGRPGLVAHVVQQVGARVFRRWYVDNLPHVLGPPLYDAAREHLEREIAADPERALDPATLRELETYFASDRPDRAGQ